MADRYGVTEKTAQLFMLKVREAMASSKNNPIDGNVHFCEFILVGKAPLSKIGRSYDSKRKE